MKTSNHIVIRIIFLIISINYSSCIVNSIFEVVWFSDNSIL